MTLNILVQNTFVVSTSGKGQIISKFAAYIIYMKIFSFFYHAEQQEMRWTEFSLILVHVYISLHVILST